MIECVGVEHENCLCKIQSLVLYMRNSSFILPLFCYSLVGWMNQFVNILSYYEITVIS